MSDLAYIRILWWLGPGLAILLATLPDTPWVWWQRLAVPCLMLLAFAHILVAQTVRARRYWRLRSCEIELNCWLKNNANCGAHWASLDSKED